MRNGQMRKVFHVAVTAVLMACAGITRAQDVPSDSAATGPRPDSPVVAPVPTTYLYGTGARLSVGGVERVRRRLRRIGPGRRIVRRELYPIVVMPSSSGRAAPDMLRRGATTAPSALAREVERALIGTGLYRTVDIVFPSGRATPLPVSYAVLDAVGEVLVKYPALRVEIGGHTDATGPEALNQRLSAARAEAVRRYLLDGFSIAPDRLTSVGYGEAQPVASNGHPTGRALNRRVGFRVVR